MKNMMDNLLIRSMKPEDWEFVQSIYLSGISTGMATFETSAPDWEKWDKGHLPFGRLAALIEGKLAGWAALSPVSSRCVYGGVAEVSVYIHENYRGMGIGKMLLTDLITESEKNDIWTLQAGIFKENVASIKLHQSVGFRMIGYREKIGKLNGIWKDNVVLERRSSVVGID